jgi:hypothetical protein
VEEAKKLEKFQKSQEVYENKNQKPQRILPFVPEKSKT